MKVVILGAVTLHQLCPMARFHIADSCSLCIILHNYRIISISSKTGLEGALSKPFIKQAPSGSV